MRELLIQLFGLVATASDADIPAAATAAKEGAAHAKAAAEAVGAASTADIATAAQSEFGIDKASYVAKTDFEAMSKRATDAETALAAHGKATAAAEIDAVIEAAKAAGKLPPAQVANAKKLGETDLQLLKDFVGAAPVQSATTTTTSAAHSVPRALS